MPDNEASLLKDPTRVSWNNGITSMQIEFRTTPKDPALLLCAS
jgi:hypothetical protein